MWPHFLLPYSCHFPFPPFYAFWAFHHFIYPASLIIQQQLHHICDTTAEMILEPLCVLLLNESHLAPTLYDESAVLARNRLLNLVFIK